MDGVQTAMVRCLSMCRIRLQSLSGVNLHRYTCIIQEPKAIELPLCYALLNSQVLRYRLDTAHSTSSVAQDI